MGAAVPRRRHASPLPLRIVTAVPLCDGHDSAIMTINQELVRQGAEVVYLGYHQAAATIARAAIQEDAHAIGLSSYNGGHVEFFRALMAQLRQRHASGIAVFGGGGGTMTAADERAMRRFGVERVFFAGTPLADVVQTVTSIARPLAANAKLRGDHALARAITLAESPARRAAGRHAASRRPRRRSSAAGQPQAGAFVLGVAGPGGAGKSTLIDEITARFLRARPGRVAILANDPSHADSGGALLGDRVAALYARDERVFFRSLATRGHLTGISPVVPAAVEVLQRSGDFELIIVESVGIGQESDPFGTLRGPALADAVLFVTSPHYGGKLQLEKIALLGHADLVALNKCDEPRAVTARTEIAAVLSREERPPTLHLTTATQHQDRGVDLLFAGLSDLANFDASGGERACQLRLHP